MYNALHISEEQRDLKKSAKRLAVLTDLTGFTLLSLF